MNKQQQNRKRNRSVGVACSASSLSFSLQCLNIYLSRFKCKHFWEFLRILNNANKLILFLKFDYPSMFLFICHFFSETLVAQTTIATTTQITTNSCIKRNFLPSQVFHIIFLNYLCSFSVIYLCHWYNFWSYDKAKNSIIYFKVKI